MNHSANGMVRWRQTADGSPEFGMSVGNPGIVYYARAWGATGSGDRQG